MTFMYFRDDNGLIYRQRKPATVAHRRTMDVFQPATQRWERASVDKSLFVSMWGVLLTEHEVRASGVLVA